MNPEFTQLRAKEGKKRIEHLQILCSQARSVEEIIMAWVGKGRNLIISHTTTDDILALEFAFTIAGETVAFASIPLERLLPSYPDFEPLNESMIKFDDQEGFSPDNEWFDNRNARLGIYTDDICDMNLAPSAAVGELVLSYALASTGFTEISQWKRVGGRQYLKLSMVFFGSAHESAEAGWYEYACTPLDELRTFVPCAYWM